MNPIKTERMYLHMKRILAAILLVCLMLGACGTAQDNTPTTTEIPTQATTEATTVVTEPVPETTTGEALYRHPLTGEALTEPFTTRPTAIVVGNSRGALPQKGISKADIIYEIETEGGINRLLAIFTDLENLGTVGPVRSARTYFNHLSTSYDAPLFHCGGSPNAKKGLYDQTHKLSQWNHIDQVSNGKYFFRDTERKAQGYKTEHTLFTTGEKMMTGLAAKNFDMVKANGVDFGLQFAEKPALAGETANTVKIEFRGSRSTEMLYDEATGQYYATQWFKKTKKTHVDAESGEQMHYRNVLVLLADQWTAKEGKVTRSYYQLTGKGKGYLACDGKIVPVLWSHNKVTDHFTYTLEDGTPLTLGVGRSYIGIVCDSSGKITYQ